jgi:hypothetical protein
VARKSPSPPATPERSHRLRFNICSVPLASLRTPDSARKREAPRPGTRRSRHVRWLYAEFLVIGLVSAPSTNPGGRDQSLVRRSQTRHHDVRHWITSFPLLHLIQQMAPRSPGVKEIPHRVRSGRTPRPWIIAVHSRGASKAP